MAKKELNSYYDLINEALSCTYTVLRLANQSRPQTKSVYTRDDLFSEKTASDLWLETKVERTNEGRNAVFVEIEKMAQVPEARVNFESVVNDSKTFLMEQFHQCFGNDMKFEDCFCGFEILHPEFKKIFERFDKYAIISEAHLGMNHLISAYYTYFNAYRTLMTFEAYCKIFNCLKEDLNSYGYPTLYNGKPRGDVETLSKDELNNICVALAPEIDANISDINILNAAVSNFSKQKANNPQDPNINQSLIQSKMGLKAAQIRKAKITHACEFITALKTRLDAANTNYEKTFGLGFAENILDFLKGVPEDRKQKFVVDSTYVTRLEKTYLIHLFEDLELDNPFGKITQKHQENQ